MGSDFEQVPGSDQREIAGDGPSTVPKLNLDDLPMESLAEAQKQANSLGGRFVTHSIYGSYGGGSICPKTGQAAYGNLLKLSGNKWC
jgi:hypothetical protein